MRHVRMSNLYLIVAFPRCLHNCAQPPGIVCALCVINKSKRTRVCAQAQTEAQAHWQDMGHIPGAMSSVRQLAAIFLRMLTFNLPICRLWQNGRKVSLALSMAFALASEVYELGTDLPNALTIPIECCVNFRAPPRPPTCLYICLIS